MSFIIASTQLEQIKCKLSFCIMFQNIPDNPAICIYVDVLLYHWIWHIHDTVNIRDDDKHWKGMFLCRHTGSVTWVNWFSWDIWTKLFLVAISYSFFYTVTREDIIHLRYYAMQVYDEYFEQVKPLWKVRRHFYISAPLQKAFILLFHSFFPFSPSILPLHQPLAFAFGQDLKLCKIERFTYLITFEKA